MTSKNTSLQKRVVLIFIATLLILGLGVGSAAATIASSSCGGVDWEISDDGKLTIVGNDTLLDPAGEIPDFVNQNEVPWYQYRHIITSLELKENVTKIGSYAFYYCYNITGPLELPTGLTTIGQWAFTGCSNISGTLIIPNSVKSIDNDAFRSCSGITGLELSDNLSTLGGWAFIFCSNINGVLEIPVSLNDIGFNSFGQCTNLDIVNILDSGKNLSYVNSLAFNNIAFPSTIYVQNTKIANLLNGAYNSENTSIIVLNGGNIVEYPVSASQLPISNQVIKGDWTLEGWYESPSFTGEKATACLPGHIYYAKWIGGTTGISASGVDGGIKWILSDGVLNISRNDESELPGIMSDYSEEEKAPWHYNTTVLNDVDVILLSPGVTSIGNYAFYNTNTSGFSGIPIGVTTIGNYAFYNCSGLSTNSSTGSVLVIPDGVNTIGSYAFSKISDVDIVDIQTEDITSIGDNAFKDFNATWYSAQTPIIYVPNNNVLNKLLGKYTENQIALGVTNGGYIVAYPSSAYPVYNILPSYSQIAMSGFDFSGWYDNIGFDGEIKTSYEAGSIYYARWVIAGSSSACGTVGGVDWSINGNSLSLTANISNEYSDGDMLDFSLTNPAPWYQYRSIINSLNIEEGISKIGDYAFYDCSCIHGSVVLPSSLYSIGNYSFAAIPELSDFILTDGNYLKTINGIVYSKDESILYCCPAGKESTVSALNIPTNLEEISAGAFSDCSKITGSFIIGPSVYLVGSGAFMGCVGITDFIVNDANQYYQAINGVLYNENIQELIAFPAGATDGSFVSKYSIPESVSVIGDGAFAGCTNVWLRYLTLSENVTYIGDFAFRGCTGIRYIQILSTDIEKIGCEAFTNLPSYSSILYVPNTDIAAMLIGKYTLSNTALAISNGGIISSSYNKWRLPTASDISKPGWTFNGWYSDSEYLSPVSWTEPGKTYYAKWTCISEAVNGTSGGIDWVLQNKILTISASETPQSGYLKGEMIDYSDDRNDCPWRENAESITSLIIEEGVLNLGDCAFMNLKQLTGPISLPESLTKIGNHSFFNCQKLSGSLLIPNNTTYIGDTGFYECKFSSIILGNNITKLNYGVFERCTALSSISMSENLSVIGDAAFYNCYNLKSIELPTKITVIGNYSFEGCPISTINISKNVTSIGKCAFRGCNNLISINVDSENQYYSTLHGILYDYNKTHLLVCPTAVSGDYSSLEIPNSLTSIDEYAFCNCKQLTGSVIIPNGITTIGQSTYSGCTGLNGVVIIPDSVEAIQSGAFYGCTQITSVFIGDNLTNVGDYAFKKCSNLKQVVINSTKITNRMWETFLGMAPSSIIYVQDSRTLDLLNKGYSAYTTTNTALANTNGGYIASYELGNVLPTAITKDGCTFDGWYDRVGPKTTTYLPGKTYVAKWIKVVEVSDSASSSNDVSDFTSPIKEIDVPENSGVKNITMSTADNVETPEEDGYYITVIGDFFNISITNGVLNEGKELTFKFNLTAQEMGNLTTDTIRLAHLMSNNEWEYLDALFVGYIEPNYMFTVNVSNFSPFGVVGYVSEGEEDNSETEDVSQSYYSTTSSHQSGGTYILPETVEETVSQTATPTEDLADSTIIPSVNPTPQPTQQSPAPFAGLLAGLGATALVLARMRR